MSFKQNRRFKSKSFQQDYWNKLIKNIDKAYIIQM